MKTTFLAHHSARLLSSHHKILWRVTRNEFAARHAGSILGMGWIFVSPLVLLALYGLVYLFIFRVRVEGLSPIQYVLYIFSGLVPFLSTAEACSSGVTSVIASKSVLSNTVFPIDLAAPKAVLMSQVSMAVGLAVILGVSSITGTLPWTVLWLPLVWIMQILALIGLNWILSLLNVVFRDLQNLIGLILMMLMIASPIAYTPEMVPSRLKVFLLVNPFAYFVLTYQRILVLGQMPTVSASIVIVMFSLMAFVLGGWFFGRAKRVIVDYV